MRIDAQDIRELQLFKYYRLVRKWACKTYGLSDAELELLIYLDCVGHFTRDEFKKGTYIYCWDKKRWDRLRKAGFIDVFRQRNHTTIKYTIFKVSQRCKLMISRIYRILLGSEDLPVSVRSVFYRNETYTDKVMNKAIDDMLKDKTR